METTSSRPVYSEVMEDGEVIARALRPRSGETVVSVASAGDNVFALALSEARHVFGVDVNPTQIAFCRLAEAAIRKLWWPELAGLFGVLDLAAGERRALLERLPSTLTEPFAADRDVLTSIAARGLASCGRLSAFVAPLRAGLTEIVGADRLRALLTSASESERARLFDEHFATDAVLSFLAAALNEDTISDAFIPASAFARMAEPCFHLHYHKVLRHLCVDLDPRTNFFLHRLWRGGYPSPEAVPAHLSRASHARLAERCDAITWDAADLLDFLRGLPSESVDAFNLSNVLDWSSADHYAALWREVDRTATDGARVFLRSFLARAEPPDTIGRHWSIDPAQSRSMALADRVGYFSRYELWTRARSRS